MTPRVSLLQHLLARVDLWLARALRRAELHQSDDSNHGGLFVTHEQAVSQLHPQLVESVTDEDDTLFQALAEVNHDIAITEQVLEQNGFPYTLSQLAKRFNLSTFEQDALLIALAPAIEPRYTTLYSYLQDDVTNKQPRVTFILELLCGISLERLQYLSVFSESAPLRRYALLEPVTTNPDAYRGASPLYETLQLEPTIIQWLLGMPQVHHTIAPYTVVTPADAVIVEEDDPSEGKLEAVLEMVESHQAILSLYGADEHQHHVAAMQLAHRRRQAVLTVDIAAALRQQVTGENVVRLALRDALLFDAIICFKGWDADSVTDSMAAQIYAFVGAVVLQGKNNWHGTMIERSRPIVSYACNSPTYQQRKRLWHEATHAAPSVDIAMVAGQFAVTHHQIQQAAATARDYALQRGSEVTTADLVNAARFHSTPRLGTLAYQIHPRFQWDDIVLPNEQKTILREVVNMVRGRGIVLEEWGLGKKLATSSGVSALFAGPPGTGKTMAAEVIAGELGLDLYKIDLSSVVNKYIGETEKSLGKLFDEASASNSILFFDEADSLFGKRSEVKDSHDRYANIEVSYLLQRMEQYDGITILATNLRSSMDEAFTRRLQFAIDFPFPDERDRLRLWETLLPTHIPRDESVNLGLLARRFKMAGGNIRNVIVTAAHAAATNGRVLTQPHLMHGIRRELQKMGRLIDERELRVD